MTSSPTVVVVDFRCFYNSCGGLHAWRLIWGGVHEVSLLCARAFTHAVRCQIALFILFVNIRARPIVPFSSGKTCSKGNDMILICFYYVIKILQQQPIFLQRTLSYMQHRNSRRGRKRWSVCLCLLVVYVLMFVLYRVRPLRVDDLATDVQDLPDLAEEIVR